MKIAFVAHASEELRPPAKGMSVNIWTYQVARRMATDHEVLVYSSNAIGKSRETLVREGIKYVYMGRRANDFGNKVDRGIKRLLKRLYLKEQERTPFASATTDLGYIAAVAWDLRTQGCDVVHVHNYSQFVPILRLFNPEIRIVLHMHCEWLTQVDREVIAPRLRQTDLIVGCSDHITERVQRAFPEYAEKCKTVYNGVDPESFGGKADPIAERQQDPFRLLFMSRVSPEKGVHVLIDAMKELASTVPNAHLDVVGGHFSVPYEFIVGISDDPHVQALSTFYPEDREWRGAYLAHLKEQMSDGLSSRVSFVGSVPHDRVVEYYRRADVLVAPSLSEAFGMSLAEAMASEVPVVAARVGGMPEVVEDGVTGLIVPPADPTALAEAIERLYRNPRVRRQMGKAGRNRVEMLFEWQAIADRLLEVYEARIDSNRAAEYDVVTS